MPEEIPIEHKIEQLPQVDKQPEKSDKFSKNRKFDRHQAIRDVRRRPRRYGVDYSKLHKPCCSFIVENNFFDEPARAAQPNRLTETNAAEIQAEQAEE